MGVFGRFREDRRGAIAVVAAIAMVALIGMVGLVVDVARAYNTQTVMAGALDSATLAATRDLSNGLATEADIVATVRRYYEQNLDLNNATLRSDMTLTVTLDSTNGVVHATSTVGLPTTFMQVLGINDIDVSSDASASYSTKIIEISLVLDVTGSMAGTKLTALKTAALSMVNTLMPDSGVLAGRVRVAVIPFAQSVNAGVSLSGTLLSSSVKTTGRVLIGSKYYYSQTGTCVAERPSESYTDIDPSTTRLLMNDPSYSVNTLTLWGTTYFYNERYGSTIPCPSQAVVPLTSTKATVTSAISGLAASGGTAGHVGIAWGWYMLSPNWRGVLPTANDPALYSDDGVMKIIVFMTDGVFTYDSYSGANGTTRDQTSIDHALGYCSALRTRGVRVFTVAFDVSGTSADDIAARDTMRSCATATSDYYEASDATALQAAFTTIANNVNTIWLSQ